MNPGLFVQHGNIYVLRHQQEEIYGIEVDWALAPLLKYFWDNGIETHYSCSGGDCKPYCFDVDLARRLALNCGDLGDYGQCDISSGYIWFKNPVPKQCPSDIITDSHTIRWSAAENYANLEKLYQSFKVIPPWKK